MSVLSRLLFWLLLRLLSRLLLRLLARLLLRPVLRPPLRLLSQPRLRPPTYFCIAALEGAFWESRRHRGGTTSCTTSHPLSLAVDAGVERSVAYAVSLPRGGALCAPLRGWKECRLDETAIGNCAYPATNRTGHHHAWAILPIDSQTPPCCCTPHPNRTRDRVWNDPRRRPALLILLLRRSRIDRTRLHGKLDDGGPERALVRVVSFSARARPLNTWLRDSLRASRMACKAVTTTSGGEKPGTACEHHMHSVGFHRAGEDVRQAGGQQPGAKHTSPMQCRWPLDARQHGIVGGGGGGHCKTTCAHMRFRERRLTSQ